MTRGGKITGSRTKGNTRYFGYTIWSYKPRRNSKKQRERAENRNPQTVMWCTYCKLKGATLHKSLLHPGELVCGHCLELERMALNE